MIKNVQIQEYFVSPVLTFEVDVDAEGLCEYMERNPDWENQFLNGELQGTEIQRVYDQMQPEVAKFSKQYGMPEDVRVATATRIWHNYGERETAHFHMGGFFSSILYLKTPPMGGDLLILDPRGPICWNMFNAEDYNNTKYGTSNCRVYHRIKPKAGLVVVLPSWLAHYSEQSLDQDPRILIVSDWNMFDWGQIDFDDKVRPHDEVTGKQ